MYTMLYSAFIHTQECGSYNQKVGGQLYYGVVKGSESNINRK